MIGGIYASAMAWAIIPHYGWSFSMGSAYQFHSWRVFVVVCALPCVSAVVALTFMPESPRFFLEVKLAQYCSSSSTDILSYRMESMSFYVFVLATINLVKRPNTINQYY
ncbi:hypothetical protein GOODEAATRI_021995 [Goodea atripinnis]|uniref:Major facilitator superfamily (MFS) profile domain-containing protein n=1 Tax=Goodea atripinnis TaxID=208336 RepID=A0ABV0MU41_9TELE